MADHVCTFDRAWVGPCGVVGCTDHGDLKCRCCGAPATRECDAGIGGLVCGTPLCADCEHELTEDGVNVYGLRHVKKGEQKHAPWWKQDSAHA